MPKRKQKEPTTCTPKEEAFACAVAEGKSYSDAYRTAYDVKSSTQRSTIWTKSSEIASRSHVTVRIKELQKMAAKVVGYTAKDAMNDYRAAQDRAIKAENVAAEVRAIDGKVKVAGHGLLLGGKDEKPEALTNPDEIIDKFISMLPMVEPFLAKRGITLNWPNGEQNK